jgi:hypothetical protein
VHWRWAVPGVTSLLLLLLFVPILMVASCGRRRSSPVRGGISVIGYGRVSTRSRWSAMVTGVSVRIVGRIRGRGSIPAVVPLHARPGGSHLSFGFVVHFPDKLSKPKVRVKCSKSQVVNNRWLYYSNEVHSKKRMLRRKRTTVPAQQNSLDAAASTGECGPRRFGCPPSSCLMDSDAFCLPKSRELVRFCDPRFPTRIQRKCSSPDL